MEDIEASRPLRTVGMLSCQPWMMGTHCLTRFSKENMDLKPSRSLTNLTWHSPWKMMGKEGRKTIRLPFGMDGIFSGAILLSFHGGNVFITPLKLNMVHRQMPLGIVLLESMIFRFHVKLGGGTFCWWFTNPGNQLRFVVLPLNYLTGFHTSQVVKDFFH